MDFSFFLSLPLLSTLRPIFTICLLINSGFVTILTLTQNDSTKNSAAPRKLTLIEKLIYLSIGIQFFLLIFSILLSTN